jgi:hypothetical protein
MTTLCSKPTMHEIGPRKHHTRLASNVRHPLVSHRHHRNKETPTTLPAILAHIPRSGRRSSATQNNHLGHTSPVRMVFQMPSPVSQRPENASTTRWLFIAKMEV